MAAEPTIPGQIYLACIIKSCIPTFASRFLRQDAVFQKIQFQRQQIAYVHDIAELKHNIPILINAPMITFDCPRNLLRLAFENGLHLAGNRKKHTVLDRDSEQQIPAWIQQNVEN
jgi:hypothetical protein